MTNPAAPDRKRRRTRLLGELAIEELTPAMRRMGFASAALHMRWAEIVGPELARWSEPARLKWPARPEAADPASAPAATLVVRVEGAFALELQHREKIVIERVNGHLGWRCIDRVQLMQTSVRKPVRETSAVRRVLDAADSRKLDETLALVEDADLKAALARLGVGLMTRKTTRS
jgi:hypothetical protein